MVYTFPSDPVYDGSQSREADAAILYPLSILCGCLNVLAVLSVYIYPAQRKFPTSVLAWIAITNTLDSFYLVLKWCPTSSAYPALVLNLQAGTHVCGLSLFIDNSNFYAAVAGNFLVSLTLFLTFTVKTSLSYEDNPKAFWCYVSFFWAYTIAVPMAVATGPTITTGYKCAAANQFILLQVIPEFSVIFVSFLLLIAALISASRALKSGEQLGLDQSDRMLRYLVVRFTLTFVAQAFSFVPSYVNSLYTYANVPAPSVLTRMNVIGFPLARIIDALVIIGGNKSLWDSIRSVIYANRNQHYSSTELGDTTVATGKDNL